MEIRDWVMDMAGKCYDFRGIETSLKRIDVIIEHINSDGRYDELSKKDGSKLDIIRRLDL